MKCWNAVALTFALAAVISGCDNASNSDSSPRDKANNTPKDKVISLNAKDATPEKDAKTDGGKDTGKKLAVAQEAEWPKPEDRQKMFMDFNMTDQDGKAFNLKQALGKPTVATFIFTRCPNPQMCPLQGRKMAWIQDKLHAANLSDKVNLLLISFDPDYDTPERLNKFGKDAGVEFTNARMLRPAVQEFNEFIDEFPIRVGYSQTAEVNHKTDLFMLDHNGGFTRMYYGMWDDEKVLAEVKRLIDEANAPADDTTKGETKNAAKDAEKNAVKDAVKN